MAHETWGDTKATWRAAQEALVERFRPLYLAEVERFAEELRPQFEAGELRGHCAEDLEREDTEEGFRAPFWRLEDLCAAHFGIEVDHVDGYRVERDPATAALILATSPSAEATYDDGQGLPSSHAKQAISWDVLVIARARGWYTPAEDEEPRVEVRP
jgi:hypothetical protein